MSLKNIKVSNPTYRVVVPSNKKEVNISPLKVRDEKVLLIASESKDERQIIDSIKTVITNAVEGEDIVNLTSYDVEYLFLRIRAISVGETSQISLKCNKCETANNVKVDLTSVEVKNIENFKTSIKLTNDLMFQMGAPSLDDYIGVEDNAEGLTRFLASNVRKVYSGEDVFDVTTADINDVIGIMDQLTSDQFQNIQEYVETMPKLSHDIDYDCTHCGEHNEFTIQGLTNFLS